jgi:DNA-directed RNA polymerase subunit K/omega
MTTTNILLDFQDIMKQYDPAKNKTKNILTKYEKVKIIGLRAEQIQRGSKTYIDINQYLNGNQMGPFDSRNIALEELKQRKLPMMVCRKLPDGTTEYWKLDDLIV